MLRIIGSIVAILGLGSGAWWMSTNSQSTTTFIDQHIDTGEFLTLEARFTPDQIMEAQSGRLLKDTEHRYLDPSLEFFPYLLMEVKYSRSDRKTAEGMILWSLNDGEMVVNTDTWETTHGFEDCINADASRHDFRLINALMGNGGAMDRDQLMSLLHVEEDVLQEWVDIARRKHLVVQKGNIIRLHFANPKLLNSPQTKFTHWLVTKSYKHAKRIPPRYTKSQVQRIAKAAFGNDFAIRSEQEVFLPVYSLVVQNPDGTLLTSFWNALNGQPLTNLNAPQPQYR